MLLPCLLLAASLAAADSEGGGPPPVVDTDMFAPNSVPMMGKRGGLYYHKSFMPMLRLKKEEKESPFVYRAPWHLGKRAGAAPDIYTASWIGSLFKPSASEVERKNRRLRLLKAAALRAKRSAFHNNYWDDIMRGTPGFRFHDNENSLYDRDIMHKRTEAEHKEEETVFREEEGDSKEEKNNVEEEAAAPHKEALGTWEDWSDFDANFDGFTSLMEDASLYPPNFGSSLTILTRVQKKDGKGNASEEEDKSVEKRQGSTKTISDNNEKNAEGKEAGKEKKSLQAVAPASSNQGGARQKSSPAAQTLKTSLPGHFLFNPWAFDSLNYGR